MRIKLYGLYGLAEPCIKPQVLMRSQQNCSKQEDRRYWTECTEHMWRSGKLEGMEEWTFSTFIPLPEKGDLKQCANYRTIALVSMQARSFFGSYWKWSEWKLKRKLQMNRRDSDKEGRQEIKSRISEYWCTRHASTNNHSIWVVSNDGSGTGSRNMAAQQRIFN